MVPLAPLVRKSAHVLTTDVDRRGIITRPVIVVPKFVANPGEVVSGYQEVHQIYNEMRQFFAKKAMSVHNGEVIVVKVTMMSLKPGHKSPSVVSVRVMTNLEYYAGS